MTMYATTNFKSKKDLKAAVDKGEKVRCYSPGLGDPCTNGTEYLSGPWFPMPHKWYAQVEVREGIIVKVK